MLRACSAMHRSRSVGARRAKSLPSTILCVARYWMLTRARLDANLVIPPGVEFDVHARALRHAAEHPIAQAGQPRLRVVRHKNFCAVGPGPYRCSPPIPRRRCPTCLPAAPHSACRPCGVQTARTTAVLPARDARTIARRRPDDPDGEEHPGKCAPTWPLAAASIVVDVVPDCRCEVAPAVNRPPGLSTARHGPSS